MAKCMILCREIKKERTVDIFNIVFTGDGHNLLTLAPYVSSQSTSSARTESTIFDQVYGGYRRRPAMISLNVQWIPVNDRSGTYQWSGNDVSNQKVKTVTFFGTGEMRGQQQAKVITPPGSDYTDAYLSAFASKSIPTRHIHRLTTAVFDNSTPIPLKPTSTPLSTRSSIKTSEPRFVNINNTPTSNLFDKPIPSSSSIRSSTYSSSFVPEKPTTYEPFSSTQYSSPQSQTFTSSYSTLLRTPTSTITSTPTSNVANQPSYTTFPTRSQPSFSTYPTTYRSATAYENIYKPMPPYSIQSYPPSNTYTTSLSSLSTESSYKPYVPSQFVPLSSSYNIEQSSTREPIVLPTPNIEKPIDRPETLLFQHDEDIRSSNIEKPSPLFSPSPDSPMTREGLKVGPERLHTEEPPATTSEPIQILENTLNKYDLLINQISEVLASVSPLSSTVSSISPGKSVLDYQLSSDTSPILPHKRMESQPSQQSTTTSTVKTTGAQRTKQSHLIREDSYDKIVTAISDLDSGIILPSDVQESSPTIQEEKDESTKTPSVDDSQAPSITQEEQLKSNILSASEYRTQSGTEQEKEEAKKLSSDEPQTLSVVEEEAEKTQTTSTTEQQGPSVTEEETKTSLPDESQTPSVTEDEKKEETQTASTAENTKEEAKISSTDEQETPSIIEQAKTSLAEEQQVPTISKEEEEVKTAFTGESQAPSVTEDEKKEETPTASTVEETKEETKISSTDDQETLSKNEQETEEAKTSLVDEEQVPTISKEEEVKTSLPDEYQAPSVTEDEKKEETPTASTVEDTKEETKTSSTDDQEIPPINEQETEAKTSLVEEQQVSTVSKEEEVKASLPDESQTPSVTEDEKKEETPTPSTVEDTKEETKTSSTDDQETEEAKTSLVEEQQVPTISKEEEEEVQTAFTDESQTSSVTEDEKKKETQTASTVEDTKEETKTSSTDEQETPSINEQETEQAKTSLVEEQQVPTISKEEEVKTAFTDESQTPSVTEDEKKEETPTPSTVEDTTEETKTSSTDEQETPSINEQETEQAKTSLVEEQQVPTISKEDEVKTAFTGESQAPSLTEDEKKEETKDLPEEQHQVLAISKEEETSTSTLDESQTPLITEEEKKDETETVSLDERSTTSAAEEKKEETITSSTAEHPLSSANEEEKIELKTTLPEEHQVPLVTEQEHEEWKTQSSDERQTPSIPEESQNLSSVSSSDITASEILQSSETKSDENSTAETASETAAFVQQQTGLLTDVPSDVPVTEELTEPSVNLPPTKKTGKHVRWDETVIDNEDDDSSSNQSSTEEDSTPAASITTTLEDNSTTADESKTTIDQQLTSTDITESQITSDQTINSPTTAESSIVLSSTADQQFPSLDSAELQSTSTEQHVSSSSHSEDHPNLQATSTEQTHQTDIIEKQSTPSDSSELQIKSLSPLETSSTFSDSTNQQTILSDVTESQMSLHEQQIHSTSPIDTQSGSITDSSKEDRLTIDEASTTTPDVISHEDISKAQEESETTIDEHKGETSSQVVESAAHDSDTSAMERTTSSFQPTIVSPIDTLADTVANRYISSDVYHGYLGEHKEFLQDISDVDNDSTTKSLLASLRETITTPITPLIETIQSVVSSMQITPVTHPSKTDDATVHAEDETKLSTAVVTESTEELADEQTQIEENKSSEDTSEKSKSIFEKLREAVTAPITAITETIQTAVSNLQSDKHEVPSTSDTEQLAAPAKESVATAEAELSFDTVTSSNENIDDHSNKEIEQTQSSLLDSIQEKVSKTITTPTETIQDMVSTNVPSTETHTEDEHAVQQEQSDAQSSEHNVPTDAVRDETTTDRQESFDSFITDSTISTSSDTTSFAAESANEQNEKQATTSEKLSPSEIPDLTSTIQKTEESTIESVESTPIIQHDEHELTSTAIPSEQIDIADKQEATPSEISTETPIEQKLDDDASAETKTTFEVIRDAITHPLTTISDKIQSVMSTSSSEHADQASSDATKSDIDTSEQTETSEKQSSLETADSTLVEQKSDSAMEPKTTFETLRDVITHPFATISEKIQSVRSTSTSEQTEQTVSDAAETSKEQQISETEHGVDTEQKTDSIIEPENTESSETKTTFETIRDVITHPFATITEKIQSVISSSTTEEVPSSEQQASTTTTIDQNKGEDIISEGTESTVETTPDTITNPSIAVNETVEDVVSNTAAQTSSFEEKEQILTTNRSDLYSQDQIQGEQERSLTTIPSQISDHEKTIQTTDSEPKHTADAEIPDSLPDKTNDTNQLLIDTIRNLINDTINSVIFNLDRNIIENEQINEEDITWTNLVGEQLSDEKPHPTTPQIDDVMQRSSNELESDSTSAATEIEQAPLKPSAEFREPSPTTTEDDSLELIHALHGHSIVLPASPLDQTQAPTNQPSITEKPDEHILQAPERSSSSTTSSSQLTSSDRYVSYAIHEMGDSSQERLPAFPLAADIPIYELVKTTSDENKEQAILSKAIVNINQNLIKDDDLTELDATENLTSYSDDILLQKLQASALNREENLDASSTDEDVDEQNFNEFEPHDVSNLHRIVGEITQQNNSVSGDYGHTYQRYDLSSNSSTSTKPQTDDLYMIPGYPGLWRPSADDDDDDTRSSLANDADDEDEKQQSNSTVKTRTIVRTTNPAKIQSIFQQDLTTQDTPLRPDSIDIFNRPLNEFSFDLSESDSFKTCPSTIDSSSISKQQKQSNLFEIPIIEQEEHQISPDEKIFLIRERERGVSLPVTMKIDYDDMALRLSASTPIDAQLYPTTQTDLPSPSTHSEPIQKTASSSRASTPSLSSAENDQQKLSSSSWLNTVNTITTTTEGPHGPLESRTTIHKSSKGPISVAECDAQGKYILIENTSRSKSIALAGWTIRQESDNEDLLTFTFPDNCLLRPNHSLKVFTKANESERRNSDLIASLLSSWHTGSNVVTTLINADGKDRASLTKKTIFS